MSLYYQMSKRMDKYQNLSAEELALDPYFIKWITRPDDENTIFWTNWVEKYPDQQSKILKARQIVKTVRFKTYEAPTSTKEKIWQNLEENTKYSSSDKKPHTFIRWYYPVAASIALLLIAGYFLMQNQEEGQVNYATAFGETLEITLPDGTWVQLNGNSSLLVPASWPKKGKREVWLDGEAFFHVNKVQEPEITELRDFSVHTNDVQVAVKGTEFNVKQRRKTTEVVLQSGKVEVVIPHQVRQITMLPGDMISYASEKNDLQVRQVDTELYTSWKENQLVFEQESVQEIANVLEDTYGYAVSIPSDSLKNELFSGSTPTDNLEVLLLSLEATLQVAIQQRNDSIIINKK